jgi:hypothetical protein
MKSMRLLLAFLALGCLGCAGTRSFTDAEVGKLDPVLRRLVKAEAVSETDYDITVRPDGTKEYGVIVLTSDVSALTAEGICIDSAFGEVVTLRVTLEELKRVLCLSSVHAVQNSTKNVLQ